MDLEVIRGLGTLVLMVSFLGLCAWAYWPANRERFRQDALLPFRDEPGERAGREPQ